jgi:hypothetical protein
MLVQRLETQTPPLRLTLNMRGKAMWEILCLRVV